MSDYYSHRDNPRPGHKAGYPDYADSGPGGTWLWVAIVVLAIAALFGAAVLGSDPETSTEGTAVEAVPEVPDAATAPAVPAN